MKLLAIIIGCTIALLMSLASIHYYGLGQHYRPLEHRFYQSKAPWIITGWEQSFFAEKNPDLILLASVYRTKSGTYLVAPSREKVLKNSDREQDPSPSRPKLSDFLTTYNKQRLILQLLDNAEDIDREMGAILTNEARTERILIQSEFNLVLESLKKIQPLMLYGATPSDVMRFKSFQSMGILTAVPFKGDIYFAPLKLKKKETLNPDIKAELQRRYKKIILGPLSNSEDLKAALDLGADGYYVENPEEALKLLK